MITVYTLGPKFSYSYNLTAKQFPGQKIICLNNIESIFEKVNQEKNARGILPIENMLNGSVRESLLALKKYSVCIEKSFDMEIEHILAAQSKKYQKIISHPQSLAQCSDYLKNKNCQIVETSSTSEAMFLASQDKTLAAIGNEEAVKYYGLVAIKRNISNKSQNITRFIEIKNASKKCSRVGTKTSMIITPREDRAGLLFEILSVFEIKKINLTKIESIPTGKKMNDYIFYLDIDGALEEKRIQDAVDFLETFVKVDVFGSYNIEEK